MAAGANVGATADAVDQNMLVVAMVVDHRDQIRMNNAPVEMVCSNYALALKIITLFKQMVNANITVSGPLVDCDK